MTTRTEPELQFAKNANRGSTRGVRLLHRPGLPNPFGVQWGEKVWNGTAEVRKVKTLFFPTEAARDKRAAKLRDDKRQGLLRSMNRQEVDEWLAFKSATDGFDWRTIVSQARAYREGKGLSQSETNVGDRVKDYLARMKERVVNHELAAGTLSQRKHKLELFAGHFGGKRMNEVDSEDVKKWLAGFKHAEAATFNNWRKVLSGFFGDAVMDRIVAENPIERVRIRREVREEVGILSVAEIGQLFHTALTNERYRVCLRRLALETFAGVRFSSACRLTKDDVKTEDKGIRHPARSIKTGKRQYVEGFPDNLWVWLAAAPDDNGLNLTREDGTVNRERRYLELKSELFRQAKLFPHPRNCLRHSFPTYHLAARTNPGLTAYLLCHRNQQRLWDHYKGNATAADGKRFEAITPDTVAALAQEWATSRPQTGGPAPSQDQRGSATAPAGE